MAAAGAGVNSPSAGGEDQPDFSKLLYTLAPLPETKRGYGCQIYATGKGKAGDRYAYGSGRFVVVRSFANPKEARLYDGHKAKVNVAVFSPNGEWIASGDESGTVIVWSTLNFNSVKSTTAACGSVLDIAWSPDGARICAVGDGKQDRAKVFAWDSGNTVGKIDGHAKAILTCSYRPERPFSIITGSEDLACNFYTGPPFKFDHSYKGFERYPNCARFNASGSLAVAVGADGKITVFDGKTGEMKKEIVGHKAAIYHFCWNEAGTQILTASADKTCKIFDIESGEATTTFTIGDTVNDMQMGCVWHKDYLLSVSLSGAINYLDATNPAKPSQILQGTKSGFKDLQVSPAAGKFFTVDVDGQLASWDMSSGIATWFTGKGHNLKPLVSLAVSCDGATVYTVGLDDKLLASKTDGTAFGAEGVPIGGCPNYVAAANKDATTVVVTTLNNKLVLVKAGVVSSIDLAYTPLCATFNDNDSHIIVGGKNNKTYIYSMESGKPAVIAEMASHGGKVTSVSASASGLYASTAGDKSIYLFRADGVSLNRGGWTFHSATIQDSCFSPDGKLLVTCGEDENIFVWRGLESVTDAHDTYAGAHKLGVLRAKFWDSETLVTLGGDRAVRVWRA